MHVVFRESHGLEETDTPTDLGQDPADLVVLSFSDSDLGAFAAGWHRAKDGPGGGLPALRLANLAALKHPLSVDTYVERTLEGAQGILVRLIGGVPYWEYGLAQIETLARTRGIALAVLPADGRPDARLDAVSTLPVSTLRRLAHLCDQGGAVAAQAALAQLALSAGLYAGPVAGTKTLPQVGAWTPEHGVCCPLAVRDGDRPLVVVTFYRAYLTAADLGPVEALFAALRARGFAVAGLFAPSLKAPEAAGWLARWVRDLHPVAVVNATAFSGRGDGGASPLDAAGVPVFQVALATSSERAWREAERGLSPADLAMHVVLPEVDGRLLAGVASFKEPGARDPALQFARMVHAAHPGRIAAIADRVAAWARLAALAPAQRRVALVLSTYPGKPWQMAHAVGLDALASAEAILSDLAATGYAVADGPPLAEALRAAAEEPERHSAGPTDGAPASEGQGPDRGRTARGRGTAGNGVPAGARGTGPEDAPGDGPAWTAEVADVMGPAGQAGGASGSPSAPEEEERQPGRAATGGATAGDRVQSGVSGKWSGDASAGAPAQAAGMVPTAPVAPASGAPTASDALPYAVEALRHPDAAAPGPAAGGAPAARAGTGAADGTPPMTWPLEAYRAALDRLPAELRDALAAAWGVAEDDPACRDGAFRFAALRRGAALVALQPERGTPARRADEYHDLSRVPRHGYVAFYLWLRSQADAMVHVGAHGTLEWLPGKAVALSDGCWPEALTGDMPVIYPFIVNDPGEAAQAKRRIGAVTLGHVPPPLRTSGTPERLARLEALLDEFSNADGLDPRRRGRLIDDIRQEARGVGVATDLGLDDALCPAEAITRIDRFVCDVKESQFGDGLHVWGRGIPAADAGAEMDEEKDGGGAAVPDAGRRALTSHAAGDPGGRGADGPDRAGAPDVLAATALPERTGARRSRHDSSAFAGGAAGGAAQAGPGGTVGETHDRTAPGDGPRDAAPPGRTDMPADGRRACASPPHPGTAAALERHDVLHCRDWSDARVEADGSDDAGRPALPGVSAGTTGPGHGEAASAMARGSTPDPGPEAPPGAMTVALDRRGLDAPDGRPPFDVDACAAAERRSLLDALDGRRIAAGPSGSPYRGRADVLPTGRNLYTTDPRSVPTRAAYAQGVRLADELVRRHLQDEGDWPRGLIVDLWGSATMRTAGEEFAMALALLGARPVWDAGSERVSGVEILPIAELDRPRLDVTLRVSGLFRDVFPTLSALFNQAVRALAARDEAADWNPYAGDTPAARVYGPAPGSYGLGIGDAAEDYTEAGRQAAGQAWLAASAWAMDGVEAQRDDAGIAARVAGADAFVHLQDLPETDLLLAADYAGHEAGFAAAKAVAGGGRAALWHVDNADPEAPRARSLREEVARVVRARAAHPAWIAGMRRHGFRGAAEIAATLDHLAAFAHLAGVVEPHLFDLYHDATLGEPEVEAFLAEANPEALAAMRARFAALHEAGLWRTRRNSILASLEGTA